MAHSEYDEDLETNPFFVTLRRDFEDLFQSAVAQGYLIAVPRRGTLDGVEKFEREEILKHVLIANEDFLLTRFHTVDGASVVINGDTVTLTPEDEGSEEVVSRILFNETFYDSDMNKVQLWCLSQPLVRFQDKVCQDFVDIGQEHSLLNSAASVMECSDFLKKFVGGKTLLNKIEKIAQNFEKTTSLEDWDHTVKIDSEKCFENFLHEACVAYKSAVAVALAFPHVRLNSSWHPTISVAVESFFLHCVYKHCFRFLSLLYAKDDSELNRFLKFASNSKIDPVSLGVRENFIPVMPKARKELSRITDLTTPRSKLDCLNRCVTLILVESDDSDFAVSADDLLPILIYIISKMSVPNWSAHLHFMMDLQLAKLTQMGTFTNSGDKSSFQLATLEAGLEHIKSGGIVDHCESFANVENPKNLASDGVNKMSKGYRFIFDAILKNDVEKCRNILFGQTESPIEEKSSDLCHPLCTCEKCGDRSVGRKVRVTLDQTDSQGWTPLHWASRIGRPLLLELFLSLNRSAANQRDNHGQTPLHVAAVFGQQNALLLLLHANADYNATDHSGNSALILASSNGQTSCVKALLYFAEHQSVDIKINASNYSGDTALHSASRWGFTDIVKILIDHGANVNTRNNRRESPITSAHNPFLENLLKRSSSKKSFSAMSQIFWTDTVQVDEEDKKLSKLFKAINVGDLPLVAFYLDIDKSHLNESSLQIENGCHPFCDCVKCSSRDQPGVPQLARQGKVSISSRKTQRKSSINAKDATLKTPLHVAATVGNLQVTKLLLKAGAQPSQDVFGQTPLHLACSNGYLSIADLMTSHFPSSCNIQDNCGDTPLHLCVNTGNIEIANLLLNRGSNCNLSNKAGKSAMEEANARKDRAILELFQKHQRKTSSISHAETLNASAKS